MLPNELFWAGNVTIQEKALWNYVPVESLTVADVQHTTQRAHILYFSKPEQRINQTILLVQ